MLAKLASKVEGVVTWGARIDRKVNEVATSTAEMKVNLNMMLSMQKALAKEFDAMLFKEAEMSPCTRVKCNKGNN
jgi:hypothetical protein